MDLRIIILLVLSSAPGITALTYAKKGPFRNVINTCSLSGRGESKARIELTSCSIVSNAGEIDDANGLLPMRFGETDCTLILEGCLKDQCYFIKETLAGSVTPDLVSFSSTPSPFLLNVTADAATAELIQTSEGFAFKPKGSRVVINYSTATCQEFYRGRGRLGRQICGDGGVRAVTRLLPGGFPIDSLCDAL